MTVVLTHLFKLLSFFINICCFLLVYLYHIWDTAIALLKNSSGSMYAVVHQFLSKSDNSFTEIWWFNDFQNGGRPPSWILKISSFRHAAFVCFLVQNFADIRQSVNELWPKKQFSRWRPSPSRILKFFIFGHVTVIGLNISCCVPIAHSGKNFIPKASTLAYLIAFLISTF